MGVGVVICLEQGADCLRMVQHPQTPSSLASSKSRLVLPLKRRHQQKCQPVAEAGMHGPNTLGPQVLKSWRGRVPLVPWGGCAYETPV